MTENNLRRHEDYDEDEDPVVIRRAIRFSAAILVSIALSAVLITQEKAISDSDLTDAVAVDFSVILGKFPLAALSEKATITCSIFVPLPDFGVSGSVSETDGEIPDWRDPTAAVVDGLTVLPNGRVAVSKTLSQIQNNRFSGQCLSVPGREWTRLNVENGTDIATLSVRAGFANIKYNSTVTCTGYIASNYSECSGVFELISSQTPSDRHFQKLENLGQEIVYGVKLQAVFPVHGYAFSTESIGTTVTCWGYESYPFDANGTAIVKFKTAEEAMSLQVASCKMNGCSRSQRPFECLSSVLLVYLCTDACICNFPAVPTPAPTPAPTTTPTSTPETTTVPFIGPCKLSVIQAVSWLTTKQNQPPFVVSLVKGQNVGFVQANPYNLTRMDPWIRPPDGIRKLVLYTIGAVSSPLALALDDSNFYTPSIMMTEDNTTFVLEQEASSMNIDVDIISNASEVISMIPGVYPPQWVFGDAKVTMYNSSTIGQHLYTTGSKCKPVEQVCRFKISVM